MRLPFLTGSAAGDGDKSPFRARGDRERGALCLHGFTGTPFEVRPLAEGLAQKGYTVHAPLLAGHGATAEDLDATLWPDWLASATRALDELREETGGRPVAIVGFSMGGLLALRLAQQRPDDVTALAVLAAPLRLKPFQANAVRLVNRLPRLLRRGPLRHVPKFRGSDVTDDEMRRRNPTLGVMPLQGVGSLLDLGDLVRADLPATKTPALIAHGVRDRTVPMDDSLELVGCLGSTRLERLWLPRSGHLIAVDVERAQLIAAVVRFFERAFAERHTKDA